MKKTLKITGILFVLLFIGIGVVLYNFSLNICANTIVSTHISPNNELKLVIFERNCGATTGFSTQASLLKENESLGNESGNLYISEGYPKGYNAIWLTEDSINITGITGNNYKRETKLKNVTINYN